MKLVVTGSSGKLAQHLLPKLAHEHEVLLYDIQPSNQRHLTYVQGEVVDRAKLSKAFRGADAVIHLAALRSHFNHLPKKVMETNVLGTFCVLEEARNKGVKKLLFSSSDALIGIAQSKTEVSPEYLPIDEKHPLKPQDPYGISKMLGEEMCRCYATGYGINIIALRFSNILCPGDEQIYLADAKDPSVRSKSLWAWVHVEDAVQAIIKALVSEMKGFDVFHVAADDLCLLDPDVSNLLKTYFPKTPTNRSLSGKKGLIDCNKAKHKFGLQLCVSFEDIKALQGSNNV